MCFCFSHAVYFKGNQGAMDSEWEQSGPKGLISVDWNELQDRRSVVASLVKGVYILENYRQLKRDVPQGLALPWWDFFNFQLKECLIDNAGTIFGAKYEYKNPSLDNPNIPHYVIAFRGTILKLEDTMIRDFKVNLQCFFNDLHDRASFKLAMDYVHNMVDIAGAGNVWLAGHSMGSAMALLAGKKMVEMELIKNENVKCGIRIAKSVFKAGFNLALNGGRLHDDFDGLSDWFPYLFVNPADPICSEYIGYFLHRDNMEKIGYGFGQIERLATMYSLRSQIPSVLGMYSYSEVSRIHHLPSAYLTINTVQDPDPNVGLIKNFKRAHGLQQWWEPSLSYQPILYQYTTTV
ncbi:GDSL esterase/lipase At4g10955-like isoform X1 [Fagus crenata]